MPESSAMRARPFHASGFWKDAGIRPKRWMRALCGDNMTFEKRFVINSKDDGLMTPVLEDEPMTGTFRHARGSCAGA
jgi:hypothetical protein